MASLTVGISSLPAVGYYMAVSALTAKDTSVGIVMTSEVKRAYDVLEKTPRDKVVFISTIFSGSTQAENGEQTAVIVRHLFKK